MGRRRLLLVITALTTALGALVFTAPPSSAIGDKDCGDFASQRAAQIFFLKHGGPNSDPHRLDGNDNDGLACESNPAPYYHRRSLPDSDPKPQPVTVRSSVDLSLNRSKAIQGEPAKLTAVVKPRGVRTVAFQWKDGRRWQTLDRDRTNRRGKDSLTIRAPRNGSDYRAVVLKKKAGRKTFTTATSKTRDLVIQKQTIRLDLSDRVTSQQSATRAVVTAGPVRRGRAVSLQVRRPSGWDVVQRGAQDRRGRETFTIIATDLTGDFRYRAVVHSANGADAKNSSTRTLTVRDMDAPSVPAGLEATSGDGTAELSWDAVFDDDPIEYDVRHRTSSDGVWQQAGSTMDTWVTITDLFNNQTYDVQVRSVDLAENASAWSAVAQVTPTAAPPAG